MESLHDRGARPTCLALSLISRNFRYMDLTSTAGTWDVCKLHHDECREGTIDARPHSFPAKHLQKISCFCKSIFPLPRKLLWGGMENLAEISIVLLVCRLYCFHRTHRCSVWCMQNNPSDKLQTVLHSFARGNLHQAGNSTR
jgi:hypothetical protein